METQQQKETASADGGKSLSNALLAGGTTADGAQFIKWHHIDDAMPPYGDNKRILVFTEGCEFDGEQFFDIDADLIHDFDGSDLNVIGHVSHWAELPYPAC